MVDAKDKFFNSIKAIENAIRDYCDGDGVISLENKAILDFYLGNKPPFYNNESDNKNNITKEDLDNSNDEEISANSVNILENRNEDYDAKFSDEELSLNSDSTISSSVVVNSLKEDDKETITMSDVGTSLYSNYAYQMSTGKSDNDKENGTLINPNDIAMAAIAALTGKIIYDKQQETDDENVSDSVENTSFNNNYVDENTSEINSVEFKKDLFDEMDGDNQFMNENVPFASGIPALSFPNII